MEESDVIYEISLGIDPEYDLEKRVQVLDVHISGRKKTITVEYDTVIIAPTGLVAKILKTETYVRYNRPLLPPSAFSPEEIPANMKYDALKKDIAGQRIIELIAFDFKTYDGTPESLKQL